MPDVRTQSIQDLADDIAQLHMCAVHARERLAEFRSFLQRSEKAVREGVSRALLPMIVELLSLIHI